MNKAKSTLKVDVISPSPCCVVHAQQGDTESREIEFSLYNNGTPYILTEDNIYAKIEGEKSDGSTFSRDATIIGARVPRNVVSVVLDSGVLSYPGVINAKIILYASDSNAVLSSVPFQIIVDEKYGEFPFDENEDPVYKDMFKQALDKLIETLTQFANEQKDSINEVASQSITNINQVATTSINNINTVANKGVDAIANAVQSGVEGANTAIGNAQTNAVDAITSQEATSKTSLSAFATTLQGTISNDVNQHLKNLQTEGQKWVDAINTAPPVTYKVFSNILTEDGGDLLTLDTSTASDISILLKGSANHTLTLGLLFDSSVVVHNVESAINENKNYDFECFITVQIARGQGGKVLVKFFDISTESEGEVLKETINTLLTDNLDNFAKLQVNSFAAQIKCLPGTTAIAFIR